MVFVTVGSQKFQFDRLLEAVDICKAREVITDDVLAQIGHCRYTPIHYEYVRFVDRDIFKKAIDDSAVIITHGGTGVIINALKRGKRVIAMPRLKKYSEHVDDHQLQLLESLSDMGLIRVFNDADSLGRAYEAILQRSPAKYESNNEIFVSNLDDYLITSVANR